MKDLNANDINGAMQIILGSADLWVSRLRIERGILSNGKIGKKIY